MVAYQFRLIALIPLCLKSVRKESPVASHQKDTIGLIGFNSSEKTMLELFFNGRQQKWFKMVDPYKASALLVDFSSASGEMEYLKFLRMRPEAESLPGIALLHNGDAPASFLTINRPLTLSSLAQTLEVLSQQVNQQDTMDSHTTPDRQTVFAEWQARKQAGVEAMQKWNKGKQLHDDGKRLFPLDRHGVQEVISQAHLVMAHRRKEVLPGEESLDRIESNVESSESYQEASMQRDEVSITPSTTESKTSTKSPEEKKSIQQAYDRLHDYCGHLPDQDLNDPAGLRRVRFALERCLLPWVEQAVKVGRQSQQPQQVVGLPGVLIYLPSVDSFFCDLDEDLLLHMARAKFSFGELSLAAVEPSEGVTQETARHIIADKLVWKLALLTSRGRISDALDLNKPLQLIRKPDFDYFEAIPHARTLSELWYSKRLSPVNMLSESALPQRYVFTFLVAADAVGYFNP